MVNLIFFANEFKNIVNDIEKEFTTRHNKNSNNKLNFINTLYASSLILNSTSIDAIVSDLQIDNIITVSKTAIVKKRNCKKTYKCIEKMNNKMLDLFYKKENNFISYHSYALNKKKTAYINSNNPDKKLFINNTKLKFVACDGTQINVNRKVINNNDIKKSKNGKYGIVLISGLYDVFNEIPISYHKSYSDNDSFNKKKISETAGFLQQIDKLDKNVVTIYDRIYYCAMLHNKLIEKNIGYMFRMKNNSKLFKDIGIGKNKIKNVNGVNVKLYKYVINNQKYNILTSILDDISIGEIKALYYKRWKIESDNKKFKYDILREEIRSKNYNSLCVDIETVMFMSITSSMMEHISGDGIREKKKINSKNCIHVLYKKLLYYIFYKNTDHKEICRLLRIIYKTVVDIVENRSFPRVRIKPSTKWNEYGNRYGNNKE